MPSHRQTAAAKRNIKKAARAAKKKRTVAHLPKATRTALGKEGAKAAKRKRSRKLTSTIPVGLCTAYCGFFFGSFEVSNHLRLLEEMP